MSTGDLQGLTTHIFEARINLPSAINVWEVITEFLNDRKCGVIDFFSSSFFLCVVLDFFDLNEVHRSNASRFY